MQRLWMKWSSHFGLLLNWFEFKCIWINELRMRSGGMKIPVLWTNVHRSGTTVLAYLRMCREKSIVGLCVRFSIVCGRCVFFFKFLYSANKLTSNFKLETKSIVACLVYRRRMKAILSHSFTLMLFSQSSIISFRRCRARSLFAGLRVLTPL